jgi:N-acetylglucosaminyldiphosphoundecaprenol N-acetyl-beta-D-mannosaminyltransferase
METFDSLEFRSIVNNAELVIPDGRPIFWAQKLLGSKDAQQVRGQDIMYTLCEISGTEGLNIGFYGGVYDEVLEQVKTAVRHSYPDIRISYAFSPPFRPLTEEEAQQVISDINEANLNILFVRIGCPKQEKWMAAHKDHLDCVMLGVGAAFDFIAGNKKHSPRWMQNLGFEWLFRLCSEPSRLWKRYLKQNPRYIWYFLQQIILNKKFN